jgi:hypothetical protein
MAQFMNMIIRITWFMVNRYLICFPYGLIFHWVGAILWVKRVVVDLLFQFGLGTF